MWSIQSSIGQNNIEQWPSNVPLGVPGLAVNVIVNSRTQPMTGNPFPGASEQELGTLRFPPIFNDPEIRTFLDHTHFVWAFDGEQRWQAANHVIAISDGEEAKKWPKSNSGENLDGELDKIIGYYFSAPDIFRDEIVKKYQTAPILAHPLYQLIVLSAISKRPRSYRHIIAQLRFPQENKQKARPEIIISKLEERKWSAVFQECILVAKIDS